MLTLNNLTYAYGLKPETQVLNNFNLEIKPGEFVSIIGPNGCGKSTLLNLASGLLEAQSGKITFNGKLMSECKAGFVFQNYSESLFPWLTVRENIAFPLKAKGVEKEEQNKQVRELCAKLKVTIPLEVRPQSLSGGQQQLVSILRSLVIHPEILFLDEPFSSLDYQTTLEMKVEFRKIWEAQPTTTLFVSHDIDEALYLSSKIVVLSKKPAVIKKIVENNLPIVRSPAIMNSPEFASLKQEILSLYLSEINV